MSQSVELTKKYQERVPTLQKVATEIEMLLKQILLDVPRIDSISKRVKGVSNFVEKSNRIDPDSGEPKYGYPLEEIQDQIGTRVVVFYKSDVETVAQKVLSEFRQIEDRKIESLEPEYFAYEARHFICLIPPDISAKYGSPIDFFELQVSTLFQHAWAQANHDLGYKPERKLDYEDKRRVAWAASQAWGADMIFDELRNKFRST